MENSNGQAASDRDLVLAALRELLEALDRRVPHVERLGEVGIAREAYLLRKETASRIEQLTTVSSDSHTREADLSDSVLADDGGPLHEK